MIVHDILKTLCCEIYKTLNELNPRFMKDIFKHKTNLSGRSQRNTSDLSHHRPNQVTFSSNSLKALGPKIWNNLPTEMKSAENI